MPATGNVVSRRHGKDRNRHGAAAHAAAMDHLRSGRPGLRLRHLRAADAAAHRPAGPRRVAGRRTQQPCRQLLGRHDAVRAGRGGRHLRAAGRLPDGSLRPAARAGLEHPALCLLRAGGRFRDLGRVAALLALLHLRRRLRRVRRGGRLALGALHRSRAARARRRIHAGLQFLRRSDGDRRLLPGRHLWRFASRSARRP